MTQMQRPLTDVWRLAVTANARYYEGLATLTVDYVRALAGIVGELRSDVGRGPGAARAAASPTTGAASPTTEATSAASRSRPTQAPAAAAGPAMVLEAVAGGSALGVFLVDNGLDQRVSGPVLAAPFLDAGNREIRPSLALDPEVVTLEPGEQVLVRVTAVVGKDLKPEVGYRSEFTIPGVTGTRVPVVLRRRPDPPAPVEPTASEPPSSSS